jgi:hypothetical protein
MKKSELRQIINEEISKIINENNKSFILPTDVYYIDDSNRSKLRDTGFEPGSAINEADVMLTLWDEYQNMQKFERETNTGSSTVNKMMDIGFNIPKINADSMFFTELMPKIMGDFTVYANKGDEYEVVEEYTNNYGNKILHCIDEKITGNSLGFNKTLNDKYQYMLIDDDEFKEFVDTIKNVLK